MTMKYSAPSMTSLRADFIVDLVRKRLPLATSRKHTLLRMGWPSDFTVRERVGLALARLVTRLDFVDHVDLALATHDLARRVTLLGRFNRGNDFHKTRENRVRNNLCQ